jgi:lipoate-protein ligase A
MMNDNLPRPEPVATPIRFLPSCVAAGAWQMAADEVMLHAAAAGQASLRLYAWSEPTVSLGYFQSHTTRNPELSRLPFVRRPTGGMTLVHHHEITYALALPPALAPAPGPRWLEQVHQVIAAALADQHVATTLAAAASPLEESSLCFLHLTPGDLTIGPAKVVGSAQRRQRGALLQHGAILLDTSPFTPMLPGLRALTTRTVDADAFAKRFADRLATFLAQPMNVADWAEVERRQIDQLALHKYRSATWNEKR